MTAVALANKAPEKKEKKKKGAMAIHWCFTDNGPAKGERRELEAWETWFSPPNPLIRYIVVGMETAPKTGKKHGQGYLQMAKRTRLKGVKEALGLPEVHAEPKAKRSTVKQCIVYCKKDCGEQFFEKGAEEKSDGQGARTDIKAAVEIIKKGGSIGQLIEEAPEVFVKYHGGLAKVAAHLLQARLPARRTVKVLWLWGITDSGKTHTATDAPSVYKVQGIDLAKNWWCGYQGEDRLVIDEFTNGSCNIARLLALLDIYKLRLQVKNAHTWAQWSEVYVTSNLTYPDGVYPGANPRHRDALFRRVHRDVEFTRHWKEQTPLLEDDEKEEEMPQAKHSAEKPALERQAAGFIFMDED